MKKILNHKFHLAIFFALFFSTTLHAQFLKRLVNNVKQTVQNRSDSKATQTTNSVLDKADNATQIKSGKGSTAQSSIDTSAVSGVLGAFAKAAAANPNDTSAADLTMKALGILTGRGGVSAADSAAAIKGFMSGSGGSGVFYQYLSIISSKKSETSRDTMSVYFTESGSGRSEMRINMPGVITEKMINIAHADKAQYSVMLYPESKTYSLNIIDTALINGGPEHYQVTRVGNEKINGYNCIHSKLISSVHAGFVKSATVFDVWTSLEVPGYDLFERVSTIQNLQPKMLKALKEAGSSGFVVKMINADGDYSMDMELVKAAKKNFPTSLFVIPDGYTESKQNMFYHMAAGAKKQ